MGVHQTEWFASAVKGNIDGVCRMGLTQAEWVTRSIYGKNVLEIALEREHLPLVQAILKHASFLVHEKNNLGNTPLFKVKSVKAAQLLLEAGAGAQVVNRKGLCPWAEAFLSQSSPSTLLQCLETPLTPSFQNQQWVALFQEEWMGQTRGNLKGDHLFEKLYARAPQLQFSDWFECLQAHIVFLAHQKSVEFTFERLARLEKKGASLTSKSPAGVSLLDTAIVYWKWEVASWLLQKGVRPQEEELLSFKRKVLGHAQVNKKSIVWTGPFQSLFEFMDQCHQANLDLLSADSETGYSALAQISPMEDLNRWAMTLWLIEHGADQLDKEGQPIQWQLPHSASQHIQVKTAHHTLEQALIEGAKYRLNERLQKASALPTKVRL